MALERGSAARPERNRGSGPQQRPEATPSRRSASATFDGVAETQRRATALAALLEAGDVVCLFGELGAGKTYFTKGLVAGLGGDADEVTSPTFVLMQIYRARLMVHHFDAYRLHGSHDLVDLGSEETFAGPGVSVVEWADRVPEALPEERIEIHIKQLGPEERRMTIIGCGKREAGIVDQLVSQRLFAAET